MSERWMKMRYLLHFPSLLGDFRKNLQRDACSAPTCLSSEAVLASGLVSISSEMPALPQPHINVYENFMLICFNLQRDACSAPTRWVGSGVPWRNTGFQSPPRCLLCPNVSVISCISLIGNCFNLHRDACSAPTPTFSLLPPCVCTVSISSEMPALPQHAMLE